MGNCVFSFGINGLLGLVLKLVVRIVGKLKYLVRLFSVSMLFLNLLGLIFCIRESKLVWWLISKMVVLFLLRWIYGLVIFFFFWELVVRLKLIRCDVLFWKYRWEIWVCCDYEIFWLNEVYEICVSLIKIIRWD